MIADETELRVAVRNLRIMEQALQALSTQLKVPNPSLLAMTSSAYIPRIRDLQTEITQYLYAHPSDLSSILPPAEASEVEALVA